MEEDTDLRYCRWVKRKSNKPRPPLIVCLALSMNREKTQSDKSHTSTLWWHHPLTLTFTYNGFDMFILFLFHVRSGWDLEFPPWILPRDFKESPAKVEELICTGSFIVQNQLSYFGSLSQCQINIRVIYIYWVLLSIVIIEASQFNFTLIRWFLDRKLSKTCVLVYGHI